MNIDIRMFLYVALGANEYLHKDIDAIYSENEMEYYHAYKNSHYFDNPMFSRYTTLKTESMKKVTGIGQHDLKSNHNDNVMKLIKRGFKYTYNYVNQKNSVNIGEFLLSFAKRKGGHENISENELFHNGIVAIFLCNKDEKEYSLRHPVGEFMVKGFELQMLNTSRSLTGYDEKIYKKFQDHIANASNRFMVKGNQTRTLDALFDKLIISEEKKIMETRGFSDMEEHRTLTFRQGIVKYIGAYSGWLKILGLDEIDITNQVLTRKEVDSVFLQSAFANVDNKLTTEIEQDMFIVSCLILLVIVKEYKKTQTVYFDDVKTRLYDEVAVLKKELEEKKSSVEERELALQKSQKETEQENERLRLALKEAEDKAEVYRKKYEESEENKKELLALREFAFSLEQEESEENEDTGLSLEEVVESLKDVKGCIVGGKPNWQNKMKEYLPKFTFVSPESKNIDFSFLDNLDGVFIYSSFTNHAIGNRMMKRMSKNDTPLHYLKKSTNVEILLDDILKKVQK